MLSLPLLPAGLILFFFPHTDAKMNTDAFAVHQKGKEARILSAFMNAKEQKTRMLGNREVEM